MSSNQQAQINANSNNNTDITSSKSNQPIKPLNFSSNSNQESLQNNNLNKSHQFQSQDILLNKININSSVNIPQINSETNISLNEKNLQQNKEQSDYFDHEVSYQNEDDNDNDNDPIYKEYTMINNKRNKVIDDIKNINERIKNNNIKIEEIKNDLKKLKEEKNKKQTDIINLLSNKESIEEIYKNQIYAVNNQHNTNNINENNDTNNLINISIKNDINDNSMIHLNSNHNITLDNEISNYDEDTFKIDLNEIKESDQKKYIEQVNYMFEDIFKQRDDKIRYSISDTIKKEYESVINNNVEKENDTENNKETLVANFFGRISLFISSSNPGKFPENKINLFLRYLLKINAINVKLTKYIKFVNKKYKEKKKELIDMINFLEKKNISLSEKSNRFEDNIKEYDGRLELFGNNDDAFEIEQKLDNMDQKEDQLSHDVVIEYEDGIDQNVEINYEDDDSSNEYDYEKEKEMVNKGLNPYNSENNQNYKSKAKKHSVLSKEKINSNSKQMIVTDGDESDKYLKELLQNKEEKKGNNKRNNSNKNGNIDYLIMSDIDNKDFIDISDENKKQTKKNKKKKDLSNYNYQLVKKNVINIKSTMSSNAITDSRICLAPYTKVKTQKELEKLSAMELDHYNRIQRIMNSGPKVSNIFGINNYNPENTTPSINIDNNVIFSPKKSCSNMPTSSNKIDKTIRIGSRQNHNFISIINMTKNAPLKKKNGKEKEKEKEKTKNKEKRKESKSNDEGNIQIINLEENFLHELKENEKNENKNVNITGNESTSNITNNNNSKRNNSNEKIDIDDTSKNNTNINVIKSNNINTINNKNEVQGYFLNIINTKQPNKEKENKENKENRTVNEKENEDNSLKNKKNELLPNCNKKTLKVKTSRELNINDIKNNKLGIFNKKIISKANIPKNGKAKTKSNYLKTAENKDGPSLNNYGIRPKTNNSFSKIINHKKNSTNSISGNYINNISYSRNNESSIKRSHSISDNLPDKKSEIKNKFNKRNIIINNNNSNNNNNININISPNFQKNKEISNIPILKIKNKYSNFNIYAYEGKKKNDGKKEYSNNRIKK